MDRGVASVTRTAVAVLALGVAGPALAVDGVIEINQARALAGGVTASDTAGFPVTLDAPGSYRLTSNLSRGNSDTAVQFTADGVSLDLNGFEIAGTIVCTGEGSFLNCGGPGPGHGIHGGTFTRSTVENGLVRGFNGNGIHLGQRALVRNVVAESNAGYGIRLNDGESVIGDSRASRNGAGGIWTTSATIQHCAASRNKGPGVTSSSASIVGNTATHNGATGISAAHGSVVRENEVGFNAGDGIAVTNGSLVSDNVAYGNGGSGISAITQNFLPSASSIQRNVATRNNVNGLYLVPETSGLPQPAYRENTISDNTSGTVVGGVNMGDNSCNGSGSCP